MAESWNKKPFNEMLPPDSSGWVDIRVGISDREYRLSKALLCSRSGYFNAMFQNGFKEGQERSTVLEEVDGVVSVNSFEMLVQWLYTGKVVFDKLDASGRVSNAIEFARFADMLALADVAETMADEIKSSINFTNMLKGFSVGISMLAPSDILSAMNLPADHPVRIVLAGAVARTVFLDEDEELCQILQSVPGFASDVFKMVRKLILKPKVFKVAKDNYIEYDGPSGITTNLLNWRDFS